MYTKNAKHSQGHIRKCLQLNIFSTFQSDGPAAGTIAGSPTATSAKLSTAVPSTAAAAATAATAASPTAPSAAAAAESQSPPPASTKAPAAGGSNPEPAGLSVPAGGGRGTVGAAAAPGAAHSHIRQQECV